MELKPQESSKLGLVARFSKVTRLRGDLDEIIKTLSPSAQNVGLILLGEKPKSANREERETAEAYTAGQRANARISSRRAQSKTAPIRRTPSSKSPK